MKKMIIYLFAYGISTTAFAQLTGPLSMTGAQSNFAQYLLKSAASNTGNMNNNGILEEFNNTENTKGRRFMFDSWVQGSDVTDAQNLLVNTTSYFFNYDELTGSLLVTENKKEIMSVAPAGIRSFTLKNKGKTYPFQHVATAIDSTKFYLRLAGSDSMYLLYKECKVRFVKSNYHNDGMIQTGNPDDEYVDESKYYIVKPNDKTSRIVSLKSKDMKNILVAQKEKVNEYFNQHRDDPMEEAFLTGLINYINK